MNLVKIIYRSKTHLNSLHPHLIINKFKDTLPTVPPLNISDKSKTISNAVSFYEQITGLSDVKSAQQRVLKAEENFLNFTNMRKSKANELNLLQLEVNSIRNELDKVSRGDDKYLGLITQEHNALRKLSLAQREFKEFEEEERLYFQKLSSALRKSHEIERLQNEKTRYISIVGSLLGIFLGFLFSNINNNIKMKQLKALISERQVISENNFLPGASNENSESLTLNSNHENQPSTNELLNMLQEEHKMVENFLSELKILLSVDVLQELNKHSKIKTTNISLLKKIKERFNSTNNVNSEFSVTWQKIFLYTTLFYNPENNENTNSLQDDVKEIQNKEPLENLDEIERDMASIKDRILSSSQLSSEIYNLNFADSDELRAYLEAHPEEELKLKLGALGKTVLAYSLLAILIPLLYGYLNR